MTKEKVAIKRAEQRSMQGALEFKNEIELLSRVHHRNVVSLVGFCFEHGEQMLVYDFMENGTLRDALFGKALQFKPTDFLLDIVPVLISISSSFDFYCLFECENGFCLNHQLL